MRRLVPEIAAPGVDAHGAARPGVATPAGLAPETLERLATRFKVLAEPMRLRLLNELRGGERTVTELCGCTCAGQANVSKHLSVLRRHGLVARRKEGLHARYRIADESTFALCELLCRSLEAGTG